MNTAPSAVSNAHVVEILSTPMTCLSRIMCIEASNQEPYPDNEDELFKMTTSDLE
jgi:hypothetical protein